MSENTSLRDKKLILLHLLNQLAEPLSIFELQKELNVAERTLRRWLAELVEEELVTKVGQKRGTKYQAAKRIATQKIVNVSSCFSSSSVQVIEKIRRPIYERDPVAYSDSWFENYRPNESSYISTEFRERLYQTGKRLKQEDPAGTYAHQVYNRLLIDLSYNSSRLEGNTYSLLDTERLLLEGASAEGKLDEEKVMILNHKEAIRYLVDTAQKIDVSLRTVCTLHYLLADALLVPKYAGKVRDHAVRIGGSTYMPFSKIPNIYNVN